MARCPACDATNPDGYRFCGSCGQSLEGAVCPTCGSVNAQAQRFCGQCGSSLALEVSGKPLPGSPVGESPPRGPSQTAERKLATIVFADVVGFTSLAERTDPELVARMVDSAFKELGEVVVQHGGTIDKYMGDSVMAVFGVPVSHDDDAERAVAAALAMRQLGGDLVFSIGINSGEVMATPVGGGDVTVIGDTVNVAARLEKTAAPGQVLCGRLTTELARSRVNFRKRQSVVLKGKSEPVEMWEALGLRGGSHDSAIEEVGLVGRSTELAFLEAQLRRVIDDRQWSLVVLCGEAGSGKTRLLNELARVAECGSTVVRAAYPGYGAMGGARVASQIFSQLGPTGDPDVDARVRAVTGEIERSLTSIDPAAIRQEELWAFGRLFKDKGNDTSVVLLIDDMHRGDERTLDLVAELSKRLTHLPMLTVLAGRTEPGDWLSKFLSATKLRLDPLSRRDAAVLADRLAGDKPLASSASEMLADLAAGNPLYLRELLTMARARQMLVDDGDCYRLTAHTGIPVTLQALLAARLDALDQIEKQAIQRAAVLGEPTAEELAALGVPDAPRVLGDLVAGGFVVQEATGRYRTVDPLLREVAYEMLPRNIRGELHRQSAQVVERPEDRARHMDHAARYLDDDEQLKKDAAQALADAGLSFLDTARHLDAMRLLERSVALGMRQAAVLIELARVQGMCGKEQEALETLDLVEDDPLDPAVSVERDHTAAATKVFTDPDWAVAGLQRAADDWRTLGNVTKEAWARANLGVAKFNLSQMEGAGHDLEVALELFEKADDRNGVVATASFLCLAKPTDSRVTQWLDRALEFAHESGDRSRQITILAAQAWRGFIRSLGGSLEQTSAARDAALHLAELGEELGANDLALHGWSLLAIMARNCGKFDEATRHVAAIQRVGAEDGHNMSGSWMGWAASFVVAVATSSPGAAPPFPPDSSPDPVAAMAGLVIEAELAFAGRVEEALERFDNARVPVIEGPLADVGKVFYALALVLGDRGDEATPWLVQAAEAARGLDAEAVRVATAALKAEVAGGAAPALPDAAQSLSDALVLRAHARLGDLEALSSLRVLARKLVAPGLLSGLPE